MRPGHISIGLAVFRLGLVHIPHQFLYDRNGFLAIVLIVKLQAVGDEKFVAAAVMLFYVFQLVGRELIVGDVKGCGFLIFTSR